jgi:hypothetical protein
MLAVVIGNSLLRRFKYLTNALFRNAAVTDATAIGASLAVAINARTGLYPRRCL